MAIKSGFSFGKGGSTCSPIKYARGGTVRNPDRRAGVPMSRPAKMVSTTPKPPVPTRMGSGARAPSAPVLPSLPSSPQFQAPPMRKGGRMKDKC